MIEHDKRQVTFDDLDPGLFTLLLEDHTTIFYFEVLDRDQEECRQRPEHIVGRLF
jgi:hypothetical protein